MKTIEWFEKKLVIGAYPYVVNEHFKPEFSYVINVSDEFHVEPYRNIIEAGNKNFWFPMNEAKKDIGLNSIYGAMVIMHQAEKTGSRTYLHCHAGINRSKAIQAAYYYMRIGRHLQQTNNGFINKLVAMCSRGYLPPKAEMESFLTLLNKKICAPGFNGGCLDDVKIDTISNF